MNKPKSECPFCGADKLESEEYCGLKCAKYAALPDKPRTFNHCIRCNKDVTHKPVHTCTPSAKYRAGMLEGMRLALTTIEDTYDSNYMATLSSYGCHEDICQKLEKLIKQHEGKE